MECWQCGVEPLETFEITAVEELEPRYIAGQWPAGDHDHAVQPPSPSELAAAADRAREARLRIWAA